MALTLHPHRPTLDREHPTEESKRVSWRERRALRRAEESCTCASCCADRIG